MKSFFVVLLTLAAFIAGTNAGGPAYLESFKSCEELKASVATLSPEVKESIKQYFLAYPNFARFAGLIDGLSSNGLIGGISSNRNSSEILIDLLNVGLSNNNILNNILTQNTPKSESETIDWNCIVEAFNIE